MTVDPDEVRVWIERIDDHASAASAACFRTVRGWVYGASCFVIVDWDNDADWRRVVRARFIRELEDKHGGHLPMIGRASEMGDLRLTS